MRLGYLFLLTCGVWGICKLYATLIKPLPVSPWGTAFVGNLSLNAVVPSQVTAPMSSAHYDGSKAVYYSVSYAVNCYVSYIAG